MTSYAMSTEVSASSSLPRWARRTVAAGGVVAGVGFISWHNHFHVTASVVMLSLGWAAVVSTVYLLWRVGVAGAERTDSTASWWVEATPRDELEREKRMLLRTIRDIEFDHQTGKLSDRDAEEMNRVTRARAIEVMKALDEVEAGAGGVREEIEREVRARLQIEGARKAGKGKVPAKKAGKAAAKVEAGSAKAQASEPARAETTAGAPVAAAASEPAQLEEAAPAQAAEAAEALAQANGAAAEVATGTASDASLEAAAQVEEGTEAAGMAAPAAPAAPASPSEPAAVVDEHGKARSSSLEGAV